jgi:hypothetical protein
MFKYWRGGFNIRISFAKTVFHTGRLQVTYTPSPTISTAADLNNSILAYREIIDLQAGNDFNLHIPYLLPVDWLPVDNGTSFSGQLSIIVLNPLRQPLTCSASVNFLIYVTAADDFEFACPNGGATTGQRATGIPVVFSPQTGEIISESIGSAPKLSNSTLYTGRSMGEKFLSIRQLLLRQNAAFHIANPFSGGVKNCVNIWPWYAAVISLTAGGVVVSGNSGGDSYSFFSSLYAYYRGSMRVRATNTIAATFPENVGSVSGHIDPELVTFGTTLPFSAATNDPFYDARSGSVNFITTTTPRPGIGNTFSDPYTGPPTFQVPYYNARKLSYTEVQDVAASPIPSGTDQPRSILSLTSYLQMQYCGISRAIGEDFQFTYYLGTPPLYISSAPALDGFELVDIPAAPLVGVETNPGPIKALFAGDTMSSWDIRGREATEHYDSNEEAFNTLRDLFNEDPDDFNYRGFFDLAMSIKNFKHFPKGYIVFLILRKNSDLETEVQKLIHPSPIQTTDTTRTGVDEFKTPT